MRLQKILKRAAIVLLIICAIVLAVDLFKVLKINIDFMGMQSSERISSSSNEDSVRYEPTDYVIKNKDDALEEIKKITLALKSEEINTEGLFEIGNINKIEPFFYEYQKYAVVKYKLLNIVEDLPKLYKATKGYSDTQLTNYFSNNGAYIENYYGIINSDEFINLAKTLSFLDNSDVDFAVIQSTTINFDYENDTLTFNLKLKSGNAKEQIYFIRVNYYKTSDNQVTPYVKFTVK